MNCKKNIIEASLLLIESEEIYQRAEKLLLEELGLKDFNNEEKVSSIVNFYDVELARRIDAEYFQEKYKIILEKIQKNKGASVVRLSV